MNVFILMSIILPLIKLTPSDKLTCQSMIFCQGDMLRVIQMSGIFKDSKTFVDMSLKKSIGRTLKNFERLMGATQGNPSKDDISEFVRRHFQASFNELDNWHPTDYQTNPPFLRKIKDSRIHTMAKRLLDIWPNLGRKIKSEVFQNPHKYSIIPVPNGFIVPGGRFREIYYWDSYWIIKGLLICDMKHTARGMIENFFYIVETYGFMPNGGRIYYLDRSHPPLLTLMVAEYMEAANEVVWLQQKIHCLEKELSYWINTKTIPIDKQGKKYNMARYRSNDDSPRPESYIEDIHTASRYRTENEKRQCYNNIRTGAETGWDFSGRWFFDGHGGNRADLSTINPVRVIPVDLNAFLCRSYKLMHDFYIRLRNKSRAKYWLKKYEELLEAIHEVLYNEEDGIWYDYDIELRVQRKHFYPSNFAPLWAETYDTSRRKTYGRNATRYMDRKGIMNYEGGIPTSLYETGEQWDMPNAWAPTQAIVIFGLERTQDASAQKMAETLAMKWIDSLIKVADDTHEMFEKYNAMFKGIYGGGGEYEVQTGFGWTNGVMLELIEYYYTKN